MHIPVHNLTAGSDGNDAMAVDRDTPRWKPGKAVPDPEDWFRYGERGGRRRDEEKRAGLETRKRAGLFLSLPSILFPVVRRQRLETRGVRRKPTRHPTRPAGSPAPLCTPNPCSVLKIKAGGGGAAGLAVGSRRRIENFSTFGRSAGVRHPRCVHAVSVCRQSCSTARFHPTTTTARTGLPLCDRPLSIIVADKRRCWAIGRTTRRTTIPSIPRSQRRTDRPSQPMLAFHFRIPLDHRVLVEKKNYCRLVEE